jgi:hypothetical protein
VDIQRQLQVQQKLIMELLGQVQLVYVTARSGLGGAGTQPLGLAFGGKPAPATAATEEWTGDAVAVRTITTS